MLRAFHLSSLNHQNSTALSQNSNFSLQTPKNSSRWPRISELSWILFFKNLQMGTKYQSSASSASNFQTSGDVCRSFRMKSFKWEHNFGVGWGFQTSLLPRNPLHKSSITIFNPSFCYGDGCPYSYGESCTNCHSQASSWHHFSSLFTHQESLAWPPFFLPSGTYLFC